LTIDLDDEEEDNSFINHLELEGFNFGATDIESGVPDPFKAKKN
jgi:hypothetical protein